MRVGDCQSLLAGDCNFIWTKGDNCGVSSGDICNTRLFTWVIHLSSSALHHWRLNNKSFSMCMPTFNGRAVEGQITIVQADLLLSAEVA